MKKLLLIAFFALGIVWIFLMTSIFPRPYLPKGSQWHLPQSKSPLFNTSGINDIQYSPNGTHIAVASSIGLWIYDINSDKTPALFTKGKVSVLSTSFSPDGKTLASTPGDSVDVLDVINKDDVIERGSSVVRLWDVGTGELKKTFIAEHGDHLRVLFNRNEETLASHCIHEVNLWDATTSTHKKRFGRGLYRSDKLGFNVHGVTYALQRNNSIALLNPDIGEKETILKGHEKMVTSIAFSPDGKTLASGSLDDTVRLWDVETRTHQKTLTGHQQNISSVAFSADGRMLASGSEDATVRLWDIDTGKRKKTLIGHTDRINGVVFSPDGQTIVSWSNDRTIRLWDVDTGRYKKTLPLPKPSQL